LDIVLYPGGWWVVQCQRRGQSPLRAIEDYKWFGEYDWHWHQNLSGCWEIKRGGSCTASAWGVSCTANESGVHVSRSLSPEGMQRCSLFEWVDEKGRDILSRQEARLDKSTSCPDVGDDDDDENLSVFDSDCGWSVVSSASSETWSVVDTP
jgi:hypothetical protein